MQLLAMQPWRLRSVSALISQMRLSSAWVTHVTFSHNGYVCIYDVLQIEIVGVVPRVWDHNGKVLDSNLGQDIGYTQWGFSSFSLVAPGKFCDRTSVRPRVFLVYLLQFICGRGFRYAMRQPRKRVGPLSNYRRSSCCDWPDLACCGRATALGDGWRRCWDCLLFTDARTMTSALKWSSMKPESGSGRFPLKSSPLSRGH
jgi:hypothetical protein